MNNRKWSELSTGQQVGLTGLAAVEVVLTTAAMVDLIRRPAEQVHGRKVVWGMALFVQPVGPIAYLMAHRRTT